MFQIIFNNLGFIVTLFYAEHKLLIGVFPLRNVEADEAGKEGNDLVAGDF